MITQSFKDIYFTLTQWLVLPNTLLCRLRYAGKQQLGLHLGCGDDYIAGMINVDGNIRRKRSAGSICGIACPLPITARRSFIAHTPLNTCFHMTPLRS